MCVCGVLLYADFQRTLKIVQKLLIVSNLKLSLNISNLKAVGKRPRFLTLIPQLIKNRHDPFTDT
jgi:hypothetical protein